jgi:hypothetical protein
VEGFRAVEKVELVFCEGCPDRPACSTPVNRCDVIKLVHRSCAAQGVPVKVTDPAVLRRVAILFGARLDP